MLKVTNDNGAARSYPYPTYTCRTSNQRPSGQQLLRFGRGAYAADFTPAFTDCLSRADMALTRMELRRIFLAPNPIYAAISLS